MVIRNLTAVWILSQTASYDFDDTLAGGLVSIECITGFLLLSAVIYGCQTLPPLKSPFGLLMLNQNVTQLLACIDSGAFFFFGVLLNSKIVMKNSHVFGFVSVMLLPVILGSFFLMSVNRLCASTMIFAYKRIFTKHKIIIFIVSIWCFSLVFCASIFGARDCKFEFYTYGWFFTGAQYTEKCNDLVVTYNFGVQVTLTSLIMVSDVVTLFVLVCLRNRVYNKQSAAVRRREMSFAGQVLIQGIVFVAHGFWYDMGYAILPGNDDRWKYFFTTSFSSNLLHVFDPIVVFMFNPEFRKWILNFRFWFQNNKVNVTMISPSAAVSSHT
ncbi:hypothetical protein L5515_009304 [Caenorhabditis briggsae]|uniref:7TM GPCR serpentine receptor class x (Srx) domain-containing protein n=1 Tax=Caenorhabditis briggsae TaxID=6238 RepID=A0AAE9JMU5_CAEBR|nr:hypothetical protein L5515_009304 [Caenorhabditis briggsae]